ncbi:MAG TPA: hypothetical protein VGV59_13670 [Pyrinomonadaceae bacterium]|nr:hypothetical protein [Pyrinomonadaceae bacterium]
MRRTGDVCLLEHHGETAAEQFSQCPGSSLRRVFTRTNNQRA